MEDKEGHDNIALDVLQEELQSAPKKNGPQSKEERESDMLYLVDDVPPWYLCIFLGMQHYLMMFGSTITIPLLVSDNICIAKGDPARANLMCTIFFVSGMVTLLQTSIGIRLPIIQGGTFSFLVPMISILSLEKWKCPSEEELDAMSPEEKEQVWQVRIREIQGAVIVASLFQIILGGTGLIGLVLRWLTPLAIVPTITMIGIALFQPAASKAGVHWGVAFMTIALMVLFSQYLRNVDIPCCNKKKFPLFRMFPVLMAILLSYALCAILTVCNVFPENSPVRTDARLAVIHESPWIRVPYPFQWGIPTVSAGAVFGMLAGVIASAIESVGDYYACARLSDAPRPPISAINRGILIEGIGCVLAGMWGTGNGTTSYSENIGGIGITKVASRRVVQTGAVFMLIFGMFGKFGAFFVTIPEPIVGGMFCIMFGMIAGIGLSSLQFVMLNSSRNLFIVGFSIIMGLILPHWLGTCVTKDGVTMCNRDLLNTGSDVLDQIILILGQSGMFVAGFLGFFLDNTIPGSKEERGLDKWNEHGESTPTTVSSTQSVYDIPYISKDWKWSQYIPVCPTYKEDILKCPPCFSSLSNRIHSLWRKS